MDVDVQMQQMLHHSVPFPSTWEMQLLHIWVILGTHCCSCFCPQRHPHGWEIPAAYRRHPPIHPTTHCPDPQLSNSQAPGRFLHCSHLILTSSRMYLAWLANQSMLQVFGLRSLVCAAQGSPFARASAALPEQDVALPALSRDTKALLSLSALGCSGRCLPGPTPDSQSSAVPGREQPSLTSGQWAHDAVKGQQ